MRDSKFLREILVDVQQQPASDLTVGSGSLQPGLEKC